MSRALPPLLALLAFAWAFAGLGVRPIAVPSEARYAEAAREMLERRDAWTPHYGGRPHLTKPPGTYWAIAAGLAVIGENPWGVRAAAGLAFAAWILAAGGIGRLYGGGRREALFASLCLATSPIAFVGSSVATSDVFLSATTGFALLALSWALALPDRRRLGMRLFWTLLGVGMFIKGPPALLPLVALLFAWRLRVAPREREGLFDPVGVLLFLVVGLGWYVGRFIVDPDGFAVVAWRETVARVGSESLRRNGPVWLAAATLGAGTLPWSGWLLARGGAADRGRGEPGAARAIGRALVAFALAGLVVFTLSSSRMPLYSMPLGVSIAVLAGARVAASWRRASWRRPLIVSLALLSAGVLLLARLGGDRIPAYGHERDLARAVLERREEPNERVMLLQVVPSPGLRFALDGALDRVALTRTDWRQIHDLDRPAMFWRLARAPRGVVAVGPQRAFVRLPPWIESVDPYVEPRSGLIVARLRVRHP